MKSSSPNLNRDVGRRLRALREAHGLSLLEFAKLIDMSSSHLSLIEHGRRSLTIERLHKICEQLHVEPGAIVMGKRR